MTTMQELIVPSAGADWRLRDAEIPEPAANQVLVRVHACGADVLLATNMAVVMNSLQAPGSAHG